MTNPVILLGTQSNGETLPVQVDATGRLVAEGLQGEQGEQGIQGPPGPPGPSGEIELPPDPWEGAFLGWSNGQLAWLTTGITIDLFWLVVAGGGEKGEAQGASFPAGGAGGILSSYSNDSLPDGADPQPPVRMKLSNVPEEISISVGSPGRDSLLTIAGYDVDIRCLAGGNGGNRGHGGSGGGGYMAPAANQAPGMGGQGTAGQGYDGANGTSDGGNGCHNPNLACKSVCPNFLHGGGGGGGGGPADDFNGGAAFISSITGDEIPYAAGGSGSGFCSTMAGAQIPGQANPGSGAGRWGPAQPGLVVIRVPDYVLLTQTSGNLAVESSTVGPDLVYKFVSGSGTVGLTVNPDSRLGMALAEIRSSSRT